MKKIFALFVFLVLSFSAIAIEDNTSLEDDTTITNSEESSDNNDESSDNSEMTEDKDDEEIKSKEKKQEINEKTDEEKLENNIEEDTDEETSDDKEEDIDQEEETIDEDDIETNAKETDETNEEEVVDEDANEEQTGVDEEVVDQEEIVEEEEEEEIDTQEIGEKVVDQEEITEEENLPVEEQEIVYQEQIAALAIAAPSTTTAKITSGGNDAYEYNGVVKKSDAIIPIGGKYTGAYIFSTNIPKGAVVSEAYINLAYNWASATNTKVYVYGSKNTKQIEVLSGDITKREKTTSKVEWTLSTTTWGTYKKSPNLKNVIQEIVNSPNYDGKIMIIIQNPTATSVWEAISYEGSPWSYGAYSAKLEVKTTGEEPPVEPPVEPPATGKKPIILTIDDIQYSWLEDVAVAVGKVNVEQNVDLVINVIPYGMSKSTIARPQLKSWYTNNNDLIEIGQHGYTHQANEYSMNRMTYAQQKAIINSGLNEMTSMGIRPSSFTAPGGYQNTETLRVLADLGFKTDFDWWVGLTSTDQIEVLNADGATLCTIPDTDGPGCTFKSASTLMSEFDSLIEDQGYAVMAFHMQDFSRSDGSLDTTKISKYKTLLSTLKASGKYEFMTAKEYYDKYH